MRRSRFLSSSLAPFAAPPLPSNTESSEEELRKTSVGVCLSVAAAEAPGQRLMQAEKLRRDQRS